MNEGKFVGRSIYIHDDDGNDLASSTVLNYQPDYMTITISGIIHSGTEFVTVLILENDGVHEFRGKIRKINDAFMNTEVAIFKGKIKETRSAKRYTINVAAQVKVINDNEKSQTANPMEVLVVNLSTSGALLQAPVDSFFVDSKIILRLPIVEDSKLLQAKIMWEKNLDSTVSEYGCEFI